MACEVAYRVLQDTTGIPIVYCSRYGELSRSVELLTALASGVPLSPTSFGLSVHNGIAGLLSMARHDTVNCSVLAAGDESAEFGILEACSLLDDGADRVLLVVADCPLPPIYHAFVDVEPVAFAWACLLALAGDARITLEWSIVETHQEVARQPPAALTTLRFLLGHQRVLRRVAGVRLWRWQR